MSSEGSVPFIALLPIKLATTQGPVHGWKAGVDLLKCRLNSAAWKIPGTTNVVQLCAGCNRGLAEMPSEFMLCFIALSIEFDATQSPIHG